MQNEPTAPSRVKAMLDVLGPALTSLEPKKLPCQVSSNCRLSPFAAAARSACEGGRRAFGGGVKCTLLPMDCACQGTPAGVEMLEDVGVLNAAQSPACTNTCLMTPTSV